MTVSLFSSIVARGIEVPVTDPRLAAHIDYMRVDTDDQGPAQHADDPQDTNALDAHPDSPGVNGKADVVAPAGDE